MFHLWIGTMAGVLLAYLWSRVKLVPPLQPDLFEKPRSKWRSGRWWVGFVAIGLLMLPLAIDFWRAAIGPFGLIEGVRSVVLPWAAGIGFGIWIYLTIGPEIQRSQAVSWIPILVALIFVAAIVSEERYSWFGRLQKLSLVGGGVEFAAPSAATSTPADPSAVAVSGDSPGSGRIGDLLAFMGQFDAYIERDQGYAKEIGYTQVGQSVDADLAFARTVVAPLGRYLKSIHVARSYNDIGFMIGRDFVENFRAFAEEIHRNTPAEHSKRQKVFDEIKRIWSETCRLESNLRLKQHIPKATLKCDSEFQSAARLLDDNSRSAAGLRIGRELPYTTLLSAMLLNAAGETQTAVRDLERWVIEQSPVSTALNDGKWFGVYRVRLTAARLLAGQGQDTVVGLRSYLAIQQYEEAVRLGQRLLASSQTSGKLSWRSQIEMVEKQDDLSSIWRTTNCANDLSPNFKRLMLANLSATNNLVYLLAQNIHFARMEGHTRAMDNYAALLERVNVSCLQADPLSEDGRVAANTTTGSFLDTVAAAQLGMATKEFEANEPPREERRARVCRALRNVERAIRLLKLGANGASSSDDPKTPHIAIKLREDRLKQIETIETKIILVRRLERVQARISEEGFNC